MFANWRFGLSLWLVAAQVADAIVVDWTSQDSIKVAASEVAYTLMTYYKGNQTGQTPGLLQPPYYWWMAGGMFGSLLQYQHYTGDTTYAAQIMQALQFQVGEHDDYQPLNQTLGMGNDDQCFWAIAALQAAENNFTNPLPTQPSWLSLAQAVFNEQVGRWDTVYCNGGLRWQVHSTESGYDLKNTISNGCFFNLAARLARYTGDQTYADWAVKSWDWMVRIGLVDAGYSVYDSTEADNKNCSDIGHNQWTYNAGTLLMGASAMFNFTNDVGPWRNHTQGLLNTIEFDFFPNGQGVMKDICEEYLACNYDQKSFKAYLARWMAVTAQLAPFTYDQIHRLLLSTAKAVAAQCVGGPSGRLCGQQWYNNGTWDGTDGPGQQMAALEVIIGTLVPHTSGINQAPLTNTTGGSSASNPNAGFNSSSISPGALILPATKSDQAGGWSITAIIALVVLFMWVFMATEIFENGKSTVAGGKRKRSRMTLNRDFAARAAAASSQTLDLKGKSREKDIETAGIGAESALTSPKASFLNGNGHRRAESAVLDPIDEHHLHGDADGNGSAGNPKRKSLPIYRGGEEMT